VAGTSKIKERMEVKVPATQQRFITEILKDYHDRLPVNDLKPVRIQKAYIIRKIMINGVLLSICLFGISWFMISQNAFLFFLIIPYVALSSWLYQRKFRLWAIAEAFQVQKGIFGSDEVIMIWNKVQSIKLAQSLYQRRKKLATLKLFTAGGVLTIPFIKEQEATDIFNYALYKTESGNKNWM
jgi:putative membrane protein